MEMKVKVEEGQCLFVQKESTAIFKIIGYLRFNTSSGLAAKVETLNLNNEVSEIVIDMTETVFVDSTVLGLIAQLTKHPVTPIIIYKNETIYNMLRHLGFHKIFVLSKQDSASGMNSEFEELTCTASDSKDSLRKRLENAHKLLYEINEQNKIEFGGVVNCLKKNDQ